MGRHEAQPQRRANLTRVAGLAGMAAAAATLAMTVGTGTAEAKPHFNRPNTDSGSTAESSKTSATTASTTTATTNLASTSLPNIGSILSSIAPSIYNPGPFMIGPVTSTTPGLIVKDPVPGSKPFAQITGFQLPFWFVNNGVPVPPA